MLKGYIKKSFVISQLKDEIKRIEGIYSKPYTPTVKSFLQAIKRSIAIIKNII